MWMEAAQLVFGVFFSVSVGICQSVRLVATLSSSLWWRGLTYDRSRVQYSTVLSIPTDRRTHRESTHRREARLAGRKYWSCGAYRETACPSLVAGVSQQEYSEKGAIG
jgi:hypothetical protein